MRAGSKFLIKSVSGNKPTIVVHQLFQKTEDEDDKAILQEVSTDMPLQAFLSSCSASSIKQLCS